MYFLSSLAAFSALVGITKGCIPPDPITAVGFQAGATYLSGKTQQAVTAAFKNSAVIKTLGGAVSIGAKMVRVKPSNRIKASNAIDPDDHTSTYGGNPLVRGVLSQYVSANNGLEEVEVFSTGLEASSAMNLNIFESVASIIGITFQTYREHGNNAICKVSIESNFYMTRPFRSLTSFSVHDIGGARDQLWL